MKFEPPLQVSGSYGASLYIIRPGQVCQYIGGIPPDEPYGFLKRPTSRSPLRLGSRGATGRYCEI